VTIRLTWLLAMLLVLLPMTALAEEPTRESAKAPTADGAIPVKMLEQWQGSYPAKDLVRFPEAQRDAAHGYIADEKTFALIWAVWKPGKALPTVNFRDKLLIVDLYPSAAGLYGAAILDGAISKDGVLSWGYEVFHNATTAPLRGPESCYLVIAEAPLAGVRAVAGVAKPIEVIVPAPEPGKAPAPASPKESARTTVAEAVQPVRFLDQWSGRFPTKELARLPEGMQDTPAGFIADEAAFARLWEAWKPSQKRPAVDFKTSLVLFAVDRDPQYSPGPMAIMALMKDGVLTVMRGGLSAEKPVPAGETCGLVAAEVSRAGVRGVSCDADKVVPVPPPGQDAAAAPARPLASVTGTVEFTTATKYGPETVLEISILDVSRADAPAITMGKQVLKDFKAFPIAFEAPYDPAAIKPGHRYTVIARILVSGQLAFINDTAIPVILGAPTKDVKVPVVKVKPPQIEQK
jgi:uncharacterized lipoprotein YbaY